MRNLNYLNKYRFDLLGLGYLGNDKNGWFKIPLDPNYSGERGFYKVIASSGSGWDHVSISLVDNDNYMIERTLRWEEMEMIKRMFFLDNESVVEFHPNEEEYIDEHSYVLHL